MSSLGTLNLSDFWKGLILACIAAALTVIHNSISAGTLHVNWNILVTTTLTAACAYLLKNLSTGDGGKFLSNGPK